jgi:small conductance mechanosensitive channel
LQEILQHLGWKAAKIAGLILAAMILTWLIRRTIHHLRGRMTQIMNRHPAVSQQEIDKRAATIGGVASKAGSVAIWCLVAVWTLKEIGFDIAPLLTGAGIAGLAVGFGAQNLVRDVISGLFILLENQVRVGDVAVINGTGGLVEEINLRTIVLRSQDGAVHVIPNGAITSLTNLTREFSFYVFETGVAYKEDTDRVVEVLKQVAAEVREDPAFQNDVLEPLEVLGVDRFADSAVMIRSRVKTHPGRQWAVGREMNRRIKQRFDALGIEIPFPHRSVYFGESGRPIRVELDLSNREQWRELIQEAMASKPAPRSGDPA